MKGVEGDFEDLYCSRESQLAGLKASEDIVNIEMWGRASQADQVVIFSGIVVGYNWVIRGRIHYLTSRYLYLIGIDLPIMLCKNDISKQLHIVDRFGNLSSFFLGDHDNAVKNINYGRRNFNIFLPIKVTVIAE